MKSPASTGYCSLRANRHSTSRRRRNAAYTLVELLVVITLATVVFATVGVLLHSAWRVERSVQDQRESHDTLDRLASQFRADIHAASTVQTSSISDPANKKPPIPQLLATLRERSTVEYRFDQGTMTRTLRAADQVTAQESFVMPAGATIGWQLSKLDAKAVKELASLLVSCPLSTTARDLADRRNLRVDAVVGLSRGEIELAGGPR
jgi:type II secretory pathway pseudopilin PulG